MHRFNRIIRTTFAGLAALGSASVACAGDPVLNISQGTYHPTIQDAVDNSNPGDAITIETITFNERNIVLDNRDVTIIANGAVIDGQDTAGSIFTFLNGDTSLILGLTFRNGVADAFPGGGAIHVSDAGTAPSFIDCVFESNDSGGHEAGAVALWSNASASFHECIFRGNTVSDPAPVWMPATAVAAYSGSTADFVNCLFHDEGADFTAVVSFDNASAANRIVNCTFADHLGSSVPYGVDTRGTTQVDLRNSVFDATFLPFGTSSGSTVTFDSCLSAWAWSNCIQGQPTFIDAANENYRLADGSLGLDAADYDAYVAAGGAGFDLGYSSRTADAPCPADSGSGAVTYLDMGAYEYAPPRLVTNVTQGVDFVLLQDAVDNANAGDVIEIAAGRRCEAINLKGKAITIRSTDPSDPAVVAGTILDGTGLGTSIITCHSGETAATVISGLTITNANVAVDGGGMHNNGSSPTVTNCIFSGNSAVNNGGGMENYNGSSPTVTNCTFSGNTAGSGGGINNVSNSSPTVTNCTFSGNSARDFGGGMENTNGSSPTVTNCIFSGNSALYGGGMDNYNGSNPTVTNCTFSGNTAGSGGGMYNELNGNPTLTNCILWGDSSGEIFNHLSTPTVTYCNVEGGYTGTGNIDADPLFVDPDGADDIIGTLDDDLRLAASSPCIDAADANAYNTAGGGSVDLNGDERSVDDPATDDTGSGSVTYLDMGAYEFQPVCLGDLNGDGMVNVTDLLQVLSAWGTSAGDVDGDDDTDVSDLLAVLSAWGACN